MHFSRTAHLGVDQARTGAQWPGVAVAALVASTALCSPWEVPG